ncbi:hypothetical protein DFP94_101510 [Fontibacillus phaseoli]|uniref:Uncharacterized protein n=1 Tax=Fontibacillus phaseoli TaxID=1416533 RepID=A0A369BNF3_9BACL|nr:hypothetical protein [Fontibacillus phaseoli]RCX22921.1 hypothetical protein DFP94_101510 [Fontibacillus phaseoli]
MAKLDGVKTLSDREIEYGGVRYVQTEGPARLDDILRCDDSAVGDAEEGAFYLANISRYGIVGFVDDVNDERGLGLGTCFLFVANPSKFSVFCRVESAPHSPAEIRALIEQKREELAELEALFVIGVDDYVRVVSRTYNEELSAGDIAQVTVVDDSYVPYRLRAVFGNKDDWARASDVVKITPAEAKAALIAQVEDAFAEAQQSA